MLGPGAAGGGRAADPWVGVCLQCGPCVRRPFMLCTAGPLGCWRRGCVCCWAQHCRRWLGHRPVGMRWSRCAAPWACRTGWPARPRNCGVQMRARPCCPMGWIARCACRCWRCLRPILPRHCRAVKPPRWQTDYPRRPGYTAYPPHCRRGGRQQAFTAPETDATHSAGAHHAASPPVFADITMYFLACARPFEGIRAPASLSWSF